MDETERAAGGPDPAAVEEAIRLFGAMRNSLQRWHDAYRRVNGGPASDPSRGQGRVLALLKDGKKVRGGGHGDASALYFPRNYTQEQMRDSILAAIKVEKERSAAPKVTLGDLFKGLA